MEISKRSMPTRCIRFFYSALLVLCIGSSGCGRWDAPIERTAMSYVDYKKVYGTRDFDPVGAPSISTRVDFQRDGFDCWWKMQISKTDWINLLKQSGLRDPRPFDRRGKPKNGIPDSWPKPEIEPPKWWVPEDRFGSLTVTSQEQEQPGKRARGWYWLYDEQSSTAIAWNWNRQYWTFEPSSTVK
jgi:hypothetical protein